MNTLRSAFAMSSACVGDMELPKCWQHFMAVRHILPRILLWGPPSTGKTHAAFDAAMPGQEVFATTLTEGTPMFELRGYTDRNGHWVAGTWVNAWGIGGLLVMNECGRWADDVQSFALGILDDPQLARMTLPNGETVRPASGFRCVATSNASPDTLDDAIRSRFPVRINIDKPHPAALLRLPEYMRQAAADSIGLGDDRAIDLRTWYAFSDLSNALGDDALASEIVFGDRAGDIVDALTIARNR